MVRPPPSSLATLATSFLDLTINSPNRCASSAVQRFVRVICVPSFPCAADTEAATAPAAPKRASACVSSAEIAS